VPSGEREEWIAQYFELLAQGFAAQPAFSPEELPKQRGRRKQRAAKNLLDELLRCAEQVLAFLDNLSIPFTNNQAERDLRMVSRATKDLRPLSRVATRPQRFVAFAVISRRCANRNMPCWLPWRRSLSASPSRSPGAPKLLQNYLREDDTAMSKPRMLTGDRPTGKLHLGHYVGTLKKRVKLQQEYESFFIIADLHMLTTKHLPEHIRKTDVNARELVLDAISAGIELEHATFYLQSGVHEISEM
jgi:tRNA synthetases class I (W and Y)/Transposase IS66 family